jgi:hypothetical protein
MARGAAAGQMEQRILSVVENARPSVDRVCHALIECVRLHGLRLIVTCDPLLQARIDRHRHVRQA